MNNLEHQIELLRDEMEEEYSKTTKDEKKILKLSQELDKLLNQYQKRRKNITVTTHDGNQNKT